MNNEHMESTTTTPVILDDATYEALALASMLRLGIEPGEAEAMIAARWPMAGADVVTECRGRGWLLSLDDLTGYLLDYFAPSTHFADGEPITAAGIGWNRRHVNAALAWAVANGRGRPIDSEAECSTLVHAATVAEMLEGLRSPDLAVRIVAGATLAASLGAGLAVSGEAIEDVEHVVAPELSTLIGRAMAGEAEAVDRLEAMITTEAPWIAERRRRVLRN